jgi:hypothetical protein
MNELKFSSAVLEPEVKKKVSTIEYYDADKGKSRVIHPEIKGSINRVLNEYDNVEVISLGQVKKLTFAEYLRRIGVDYEYYSMVVMGNPDIDQNEILRRLHQQAVDKRTKTAARKHAEYTRESATRDNLQQETAKDHSAVFLQTVNDLDVYGLSAQSVVGRHDYLDGIDEILILDHESLQSSGEKKGRSVYVGIQRSFEDKKAEVVRDPIRFIPEKPEAGAVFRVFIEEKLEDYIDIKTGISRWQKLLDMRTVRAKEAGLDPREFARTKKNQGMPAVKNVLSGGVEEQLQRVENVLQNIKEQLESYIHSADFKNQPLFVQAELRSALENMKIEDFLLAINDLKN